MEETLAASRRDRLAESGGFGSRLPGRGLRHLRARDSLAHGLVRSHHTKSILRSNAAHYTKRKYLNALCAKKNQNPAAANHPESGLRLI
jgi:hypothetical protein